jgi:hypothetical protein
MPMTGPDPVSTPFPFPLELVEEDSACAATGKRHRTANIARSTRETDDTDKADLDFVRLPLREILLGVDIML